MAVNNDCKADDRLMLACSEPRNYVELRNDHHCDGTSDSTWVGGDSNKNCVYCM